MYCIAVKEDRVLTCSYNPTSCPYCGPWKWKYWGSGVVCNIHRRLKGKGLCREWPHIWSTVSQLLNLKKKLLSSFAIPYFWICSIWERNRRMTNVFIQQNVKLEVSCALQLIFFFSTHDSHDMQNHKPTVVCSTESEAKGIYSQEACIHLLSRVDVNAACWWHQQSLPQFSLLHRKQEADRKCVLCGDSAFPVVLVEWLCCFQKDAWSDFLLFHHRFPDSRTPQWLFSPAAPILLLIYLEKTMCLCSSSVCVSRYLWIIVGSCFGFLTLPIYYNLNQYWFC